MSTVSYASQPPQVGASAHHPLLKTARRLKPFGQEGEVLRALRDVIQKNICSLNEFGLTLDK